MRKCEFRCVEVVSFRSEESRKTLAAPLKDSSPRSTVLYLDTMAAVEASKALAEPNIAVGFTSIVSYNHCCIILYSCTVCGGTGTRCTTLVGRGAKTLASSVSEALFAEQPPNASGTDGAESSETTSRSCAHGECVKPAGPKCEVRLQNDYENPGTGTWGSREAKRLQRGCHWQRKTVTRAGSGSNYNTRTQAQAESTSAATESAGFCTHSDTDSESTSHSLSQATSAGL